MRQEKRPAHGVRTGLRRIGGPKGSEELGHRRRAALGFDLAGVEARHRLVADDMGLVGAEAIEFRPHRTAISAEHADLHEIAGLDVGGQEEGAGRSEEPTSELQSLMRNSSAVFRLKKKIQHTTL